MMKKNNLTNFKNKEEKHGVFYCSIAFVPVFFIILMCIVLLESFNPPAIIISIIILVMCQNLLITGINKITCGLEYEIDRLKKYEDNCVEPTIYIDMDEVVYNLSEVVIDNYNKDYKKAFRYLDNTKWMWQDTEAPEEYYTKLLQKEGLFNEGKAIEFSITVINELRTAGYNIIFLSQPQWNGNCMVEKMAWLKFHFDWFDEEKNIIFTSNKAAVSGGPNKYIIDDNPNHFKDGWVEGENALLFKRPWNKGQYTWLQIGSKLIAERSKDNEK